MSDDIKIDLSEHHDVFESAKLDLNKNIIFVYGENGTGKTTISSEIEKQLQSKYTVRSFKDFTTLIGENKRLNAISLGRANTELQEKINNSIRTIKDLEQQLNLPEDNATNNLFSNLQQATNEYNSQKNKVDGLLQEAASQIKNIKDPQIAQTTYNRNSFEKEISLAKSLSETETKIAKDTAFIKQKPDMPTVSKITNCKLNDIVITVNKILNRKVTPSVVMKTLDDDLKLREFARMGKELHKRGDKCAFCGNAITDERWAELDGYFNDEVLHFRELIQQKIDKTKKLILDFKGVKIPELESFYPELQEKAGDILLDLANKNAKISEFLDKIEKSLIDKLGHMFNETKSIDYDVPEDISETLASLNQIILDNNKYSADLAQRIQNAKNRLRYNAVYEQLKRINYTDEHESLASLQEKQKTAQDNYDKAKNMLDSEKTKLNNYYQKTQDESAVVNNINEILLKNGHSSFSLKLVTDNDCGQTGQYKVIGRNLKERDITELSTGEKNTVAILYFLSSLSQDIEMSSAKPIFVIIDDPVNSNDSFVQYMIISKITELYNNNIFKNHSKIIILTHNTHFFINIRPYGKSKYKPKYGSYHLIPNRNDRVVIEPILNYKNDIRTDYDSLWARLVSSYYDNDECGMLSVARRICSSYIEFNRSTSFEFYGDSGAKKLLDVNSHEIVSGEMSSVGTTAARLKAILTQLFDKNGAKGHFEAHWEYGESINIIKQNRKIKC